MNELTRYIRRHHIALLALFVALGGTSYAAVSLPRGSVGAPQIQNGAVAAQKIRDGAVKRKKIRANAVDSAKVANGSLLAKDFASGQLPKGERGPAGPAEGPAGGALTGTYPNPGIANGAVGPNQLGVFPSVRLVRPSGSTQTIAPTVGGVAGPANALTWPSNADDPNPPVRGYDNSNMFDFAANPSNVVVPLTGRYLVAAEVRWEADPTGTRTLNIHGPAGRIVVSASQDAVTEAGAQTKQAVSTVAHFTAGNALFASAGQSATAPDLDIQGSLDQVSFSVTYLGP